MVFRNSRTNITYNMGIHEYTKDDRLMDIGTGKLTGKKIVEIASLDPNWYTDVKNSIIEKII